MTRRRLVRIFLVLLAIPLLGLILFVVNGTLLASKETPRIGTTSHAPTLSPTEGPPEIKVLALNIAKCFAHRGGMRFADRSAVKERIRRIAEVINREKPDLVFLSEVIFDCSPCAVNQVTELAEKTGMHSWAFGENYNFGLPFYRVVGGNAILSRRPLEPVANPDLAGRGPFWRMHNNRRVLWCAQQIGGRRVLLASVHTDSFSLTNNLKQTGEILDFANGQPAILAGDFNARPTNKSIQAIRDSERFTGAFDGPSSFPANNPDRRIDFVFAPVEWELLDCRVLETDVSDHRPVVSTFRVSRLIASGESTGREP